MPGKRLPMRKIRDVLRLRAGGLSKRQIADGHPRGLRPRPQAPLSPRTGLALTQPRILLTIFGECPDYFPLRGTAMANGGANGFTEALLRRRYWWH